ncbi:MAG: DNA-directed RNA polymerase subunit beta, partial [Myxococcota bacterium]|nr:DNA-directed RNA polymerase subunit beta [Myxococcota bacterium]
MSDFLANNYRFRHSYAKTLPWREVDNLIRIQTSSYEEFLQTGVSPEERRNVGLQAVFNSVFPIHDFNERASLEFSKYELQEPTSDVDECREKGQTYAAQLKVHVRMNIFEEDEETKEKIFSHSQRQQVFFGDIPLMTENGTFIINGTERVVVSQLHRSPGVFFSNKVSKTTLEQKTVLTARIIPNRGSWIDFEFDTKDRLFVRIDRRKKLPAIYLLLALGYDMNQLLSYFYPTEVFQYSPKEGSWTKTTTEEILTKCIAFQDYNYEIEQKGKMRKKVVRKGKKFLKNNINHLHVLGRFYEKEVEVLDGTSKQVLIDLPSSLEEAIGTVELQNYTAEDIYDEEGEVIIPFNTPLTAENIAKALEHGITKFKVLYIDGLFSDDSLRHAFETESKKIEEKKIKAGDEEITNADLAILEIFQRMRPNDPSNIEMARKHFINLLFEPSRYDLSTVGRIKINERLYVEDEEKPTEETKTLVHEDILRVIRYLYDLKSKRDGAEIDDIDHLGNRRVRSVGELLVNQFRIGLVRMEKAIKERMSLGEIASMAPNDIVNAKPVTAVIKEFFGASQLSQFMDQTNPLSEVTHKRRLSALGPGGLTRERAGNEVRDVHTTHYGRICPVETPEGPNVGLIASLATYARVNKYGFIETPYRKCEGGTVTNEVSFYSATAEKGFTVSQAAIEKDKDENITAESVIIRQDGDIKIVKPEQVDLVDV